MRLTLRQLEVFCAVAESGSTIAGADLISLSQSATSAAVNELEAALGTQLFDRVRKRLMLNEDGRALYPAAKQLLEAAGGIESGFSAPKSDLINLRLGASTTIGNYLLPELLASFRAKYPSCRLEVMIGNTLEVSSAVGEFRLDLGLIEGPCHVRDLTVSPWIDDELVIVAAASSPWTAMSADAPLTFQQLRQAAWMLREPGSGTREAVEQALLPELRHLEPDMVLSSSEAIKNAVASGLGVTCLSRCVVADLVASGRLVVLRTTFKPLSRTFTVVRHRQKYLTHALKAFLKTCFSHQVSRELAGLAE